MIIIIMIKPVNHVFFSLCHCACSDILSCHLFRAFVKSCRFCRCCYSFVSVLKIYFNFSRWIQQQNQFSKTWILSNPQQCDNWIQVWHKNFLLKVLARLPKAKRPSGRVFLHAGAASGQQDLICELVKLTEITSDSPLLQYYSVC